MTIIPQGHSPVPYRGFGYRNIKLHEPRVYGIPNIPISDAPLQTLASPGYVLGPYDPFPCDHRHTLCRDSGFRDFSWRDFLVTENPKMSIPDARVSSLLHVTTSSSLYQVS
jgi:hypothetical protein